MSAQRLYNTILAPHTTEKTTNIGEQHNQFGFKVAVNATKQDVKKAVEHIFNVTVKSVRICNVKGKKKTYGRTIGKRSNWKKAYVALDEGHDISFENLS